MVPIGASSFGALPCGRTRAKTDTQPFTRIKAERHHSALIVRPTSVLRVEIKIVSRLCAKRSYASADANGLTDQVTIECLS